MMMTAVKQWAGEEALNWSLIFYSFSTFTNADFGENLLDLSKCGQWSLYKMKTIISITQNCCEYNMRYCI